MSGFMDLNVTFCENKSSMQQVIDTAAHLGYSTVAVNYTFEATSSKKTGRSRPIRVLNRLTLLMSDSGYFWPNQKAYEPYDLLAVQANTEKLFHAACTLLDVDVISLPVTEKLPFFLKRAPVNAVTVEPDRSPGCPPSFVFARHPWAYRLTCVHAGCRKRLGLRGYVRAGRLPRHGQALHPGQRPRPDAGLQRKEHDGVERRGQAAGAARTLRRHQPMLADGLVPRPRPKRAFPHLPLASAARRNQEVRRRCRLHREETRRDPRPAGEGNFLRSRRQAGEKSARRVSELGFGPGRPSYRL
ncbi:ribonuclease P protein subunit p30 isoform X2 [Stigmatopora argus]